MNNILYIIYYNNTLWLNIRSSLVSILILYYIFIIIITSIHIRILVAHTIIHNNISDLMSYKLYLYVKGNNLKRLKFIFKTLFVLLLATCDS